MVAFSARHDRSMILGELAAVGPFFAVETHDPDVVAQPPWYAMSELAEDPEVLRDRALIVRSRLAVMGGQAPDAVELRVAVSVAQLGLVARMLSPAMAAAVLDDVLLPVDLPGTRWQRTLGAFPLSVPLGAGTILPDASLAQLADFLTGEVLAGSVRALVEAAKPLSVSDHVLWGNVASAVNGAATMIATARPESAGRAAALAALLQDRPPLRGRSTTTPDGRFRRRSCCLIYRAAPDAAGPVCGDCVLGTA